MAIPALIAANIVSDFIGGMMDKQAQNEQQSLIDSSKRNARGYISNYKYDNYNSPYEDFFNNLISTYSSGNLTAGQQQQLNQAANEGASSIATVMANRGGTIGGQLAATQKMNNDLANQRLALSDQNVNTALNIANTRDQFNLSDWLNQQQANMRQKELLAQYS